MNASLLIRFTVDAEAFLGGLSEELRQEVLKRLKGPALVSRAELEDIVREIEEERKIQEVRKELIVEVRKSAFQPIAKEYEADIYVDRKKEVTGKSRSKGEVKDFIEYFRNRFRRLKSLFPPSHTTVVDVGELSSFAGEVVSTIGMVYEVEKGPSTTRITLEDLTGRVRVYVDTANNPHLEEKVDELVPDDVIMVEGKMARRSLIAKDIIYPDIPPVQFPLVERDLAVAYISDVHVGSSYFMEKLFEKFVRWLQGKEGNKEAASKVKYVVVAGDLVDGIGIYPGQEKELVVRDIEKQYKVFQEWMELIPDYIEVIIAPGNHDAVRRGEPSPALERDLLSLDAHLVGNPSRVTIEGVKHLIYHGTSMDSLIAAIPWASYDKPERVMVEYLKKRHLSPIYGTNPIIPEAVDYLIVDEPPNVMHMGHVHKNGYANYKGVFVINSGTFQDQTPYQLKQGHIPTPGEVPVLELREKRLKRITFHS